jgi:diacylglycerol kinase (ATP)
VAAAGVIVAKLATDGARPMDAVRVNDQQWFGCVLSAGFDSKVNDRANRMSWPRGRMRYNVAIVAELGVFKPIAFTIDLDGDRWQTEAMLVAVGNARSYGAGMQICPDAVIDDGLVDVTVLGPVSKPAFLRAFPKVFKGTHRDHPAVTMRRAKTVSLAADDVTVYADGEYLGELPITCETVPGAVRVLA